jgi:hypothetical protein
MYHHRILNYSIAVCSMLILLTAGLPAYSQSPFSVRSIGSQKCSVMTQAIQEKSNTKILVYAQWLAGYLTGKNASAKSMDLYPIREPLEEWVRFVALVCAANPDQLLVAVTESTLMRELTKYKTDVGAEVVVITYDPKQKPITVYREFLIKSQYFLRSNGFRISADGEWGGKTQDAFAKYKEKLNIAGPPVPDAFFLLKMISKK